MRARRLSGPLVLAFTVVASTLAAQEGTITGRIVTASALQPLSGAQVFVVGMNVGTLTQADGTYRLANVPVGTHTVSVQTLGYRSAARSVQVSAGESVIANFELVDQVLAMDEIIVTGTPGGTQRRALGNDVTRLTVESIATPASNVQGLIGTRAAGLSILPAGGQVGKGGPMRIRGASSMFLGNDPIVYVDGVRIDANNNSGANRARHGSASRLNDIDPATIASIEVIKGPAAATLYGTEASNGVIQIITKQGSEGRPTLDLSVQLGANWLHDPSGYVGTSYWWNPATQDVVSFNLWEHEKEFGLGPVFSTGMLQKYNLSLQGGTSAVRYYSSLSWDDNVGYIDYNWEKKLSGRLNMRLIPLPNVNVDMNIGFTQGTNREAGVADADISAISWGAQPIHLVRPLPSRGFLWGSPEAMRDGVESIGEIDRTIASVQATHQIGGWLTHRLTAGRDVGWQTNTFTWLRMPEGSSYFYGVRSLGQKDIDTILTALTNLDYSATAQFDLTPALNSSSSVGFQYYQKAIESRNSAGRVFPAPVITSVGGAALTSASENFLENRTVGTYAQQQFGWNNRVFLTGAVRMDDNSAFGSNFDAAVYPKIAGTWVVNEESFWRIPSVSTFRLRSAWGASGMQPDIFAAQRLYSPTTGPGGNAGIVPGAIGNPDLAPERAEELEVGFDLGLFDERIGATFTYYNKTTSDAILNVPVAPSTGFPGSQFINAGLVKGWGTEFTLNALMVDRRNFSWDLAGSFATMKDRVESLSGNAVAGFSGHNQFHEGYPLGAVFWWKVVSADLVRRGVYANAMCDGGPSVNNAPVPCSQAPHVYWGRGPTPTWEFGVENGVTVMRNFRVSARVDGRGGHIVGNNNAQAAATSYNNTYKSAMGNDAIYQVYRAIGRNPLSFTYGDFAKLRNITATYTIPGSWISTRGVSRASITTALENIWTIYGAKYPNVAELSDGFEMSGPASTPDIEMGSQSSNATANSLGYLPNPMRLITTVRVTF